MSNPIDNMKESFAALLEQSFADQSKQSFEGSVLKGTIVAIRNDYAVIDVGLKSEGRVTLKEFMTLGVMPELQVGDKIDVYVERMEDKNGEAVLSVEKAKREAVWDALDLACKQSQKVVGVIFGRVKGGFTVDLSGTTAFLPRSQVDVRPTTDIEPLLNIQQPFIILKMDKVRNNIVVSRRAVLEQSRAEARSELVANMQEGQVLDGVVKNITDYGAFIDLGGVDGLLHVTDIAWTRVNHPADKLKVGQEVKVVLIRFNKDTQRISLGMKQLESDPWQGVQDHFPSGTRHTVRITNISDFGAFAELKPGVEGLIHLSEMSWTKKNVHPTKILSVGNTVDVMVLEVDGNKRRISLGMKQCQNNPWQEFRDNNPSGTVINGEIKNITEFGLFVEVAPDLDGMVHLSDISWNKSPDEAVSEYKKGMKIDVVVLEVDADRERISLGIKQLTQASTKETLEEIKKGTTITCIVKETTDKGIEVELVNHEGISGFIKKIDLSRDRSEQRIDRFAIGEKIDAKVVSVEAASRKVNLSIKARELDEEREAMKEYGSSDSGASLKGIFEAAMTKATAKKKGKADSKKQDAEGDV